MLTPAGRLGVALWGRMMARALEGEQVRNAAGYRPGSPAHRARVRTWQALAALSPFLTTQEQTADAFKAIWRCVEVCAPHCWSTKGFAQAD